jgi:hypothetical protein
MFLLVRSCCNTFRDLVILYIAIWKRLSVAVHPMLLEIVTISCVLNSCSSFKDVCADEAIDECDVRIYDG